MTQQEPIIQAPYMATLHFTRKNSFPGTFGGGEELDAFLQVPLIDANGDTVVGDTKALEAVLDDSAAFLKAWIYKQLGTAFDVDGATGVVVGEVPAPHEKGSGKKSYPAKGGASSKPKASGPSDKDELWQLLATATKNGDNFKASTGETVWDNRVGKRNPNAPDFKFADSGDGLWLDKAPADFEVPA